MVPPENFGAKKFDDSWDGPWIINRRLDGVGAFRIKSDCLVAHNESNLAAPQGKRRRSMECKKIRLVVVGD
jgi:hypothetical protein